MTLRSRTAGSLAVRPGGARSGARPAPAGEELGPTASDVHRRLSETIGSGALVPGERLGGERDLAKELGVSRAALRAALTALERDGVVDRVRGRGGGTFVARRKVERDSSRIVGVPELLRSQGFEAGTKVVSTAVLPADDAVARGLLLPPGDLVFEIVRLRLADGEPISLEHARFPASRFPGLLDQPLGGSLYEMFAERYGVSPAEAVEQIEVVGAGDEAAQVLSVPVDAALLSLTRTTSDEVGEPFEYSRDLFRADRTRIVVRSTQPSGWRHSATMASQTR